MDSPKYSYPPGLFTRLARDIVFLRRRNFHNDAKACIDHLDPPLQMQGKENLPAHGPCVLTVNHYHRPGFGVQWLALAIAAQVPIHVHWIITDEFTTWPRPFGACASRIFLQRLACIYDFTTMPPMPPRPQDVERRAAAIRAVLEYVRSARDPVLGLAPEGYDSPAGVLTRPAAGVGRFGLLLAKAGLAFIPVGAYEADGTLYLHFGERYELRVDDHLSTDEKDHSAIQTIMENIALLLPLHLRGEFA